MLPALALLLTAHAVDPDPFVRWSGHTERDGFGSTYGIAVADVDGDGWTDVIAPQEHALWLNIDAGNWAYVDIPQLRQVGDGVGNKVGHPRLKSCIASWNVICHHQILS